MGIIGQSRKKLLRGGKQRLARFCLICLLFCPLSAHAAKKSLYTDFQASLPANDNGDSDAPRVYPVLYYSTPQLFSPHLAAKFLVSGLYNSARFILTPQHQPNVAHWSFFWETRVIFLYAGDAPVIDGDKQQEFSFNSNMVGNNIGAQFAFQLFKMKWRTGFRYDADVYLPYGSTDTSQFVRPDTFVEHGPTVFIEPQDLPPLELLTYGILPQIKVEQKFRDSLRPWGPVGNFTDYENYFRISSLNLVGIPVGQRWVISTRFFGGYVSNTDRYSAIKFGSMINAGNSTTSLPGPGMYTNEAFVHWIVGGSIGPRIIMDREAKAKYAIKPFLHAATYNEILPYSNRNNSVAGMGIGLMGRLEKKFSWEVDYANVFGLERESDPSNEIYVRLSWVPWEKEVE